MFPNLWKYGVAPFCACCLLVTKQLRTIVAWPGPFAHFGISWSNPFAVFQICVKSCRAGATVFPVSVLHYAHICKAGHDPARPGSDRGTHDTPHFCRYLTVQKSREIKMTKSAPTCRVSRLILTATIGRQVGGLAQFPLRIQECENGWRQTKSTARFRFCSILVRLCLLNAQSCKWQKNAWGPSTSSHSNLYAAK